LLRTQSRDRAGAALSNKSVRSILMIGRLPQVSACHTCDFTGPRLDLVLRRTILLLNELR